MASLVPAHDPYVLMAKRGRLRPWSLVAVAKIAGSARLYCVAGDCLRREARLFTFHVPCRLTPGHLFIGRWERDIGGWVGGTSCFGGRFTRMRRVELRHASHHLLNRACLHQKTAPHAVSCSWTEFETPPHHFVYCSRRLLSEVCLRVTFTLYIVRLDHRPTSFRGVAADFLFTNYSLLGALVTKAAEPSCPPRSRLDRRSRITSTAYHTSQPSNSIIYAPIVGVVATHVCSSIPALDDLTPMAR
jgi:hypothetical protein